MSAEERLPLDLTWSPDGHASEIALGMLADGEGALLVEGVERHVEACEVCSIKLGEAALLSLRATEELPALSAELATTAEVARVAPVFMPIVRPAARPFPVRAIAAALVVAIVGMIPALLNGLPRLPDFMRGVLRALPVVGRAAFSLFKSGASHGLGITPAVSWLAALLFVVFGVALAMTMSRARPIQGEVR